MLKDIFNGIGHAIFYSKTQIVFLFVAIVVLRVVVFFRRNYRININTDFGAIAIGVAFSFLFARDYLVNVKKYRQMLEGLLLLICIATTAFYIFKFAISLINNYKDTGTFAKISRIPVHDLNTQRSKIIFVIIETVAYFVVAIVLLFTY